ncbi:hypothetical protein AVEN_60559-1 [Araneus ventricosus]|uniref:Uncharacterized protein n=1 Tax=Araneus ventricosus TaxID=182803 RepID=A0A4Y2EY78_ARAVE|nr:hypothetical protein AVEN_60559-1 [Araneus ventricosus]
MLGGIRYIVAISWRYRMDTVERLVIIGITSEWFDETRYAGSSLDNLKYCRGNYALTQSLRVGWDKVCKIHAIKRLIDIHSDFDETRYACSSLVDLKCCLGKYALTQSLSVGWGKVSKMHLRNRPIELIDDFGSVSRF